MSNARFSRAVALVLLLAAAPAVHADWIPWTYSWSNSPQTILSDNGGGNISLTNEPTLSAVGDSDIVATNIHTYSTAAPGSPDKFTNKAYTLNLTLTDSTSGQTGTAAFTGVFNGTLTAMSSNITNTFTGPTTAVLDLGSNQYTITLTAYTPPGPTGSINAGAIGARATIVVNPIGIVEDTPEPSAAILAAFGIPLVMLQYRRSARSRARRLISASPGAGR
jgi:hypothetical protein